MLSLPLNSMNSRVCWTSKRELDAGGQGSQVKWTNSLFTMQYLWVYHTCTSFRLPHPRCSLLYSHCRTLQSHSVQWAPECLPVWVSRQHHQPSGDTTGLGTGECGPLWETVVIPNSWTLQRGKPGNKARDKQSNCAALHFWLALYWLLTLRTYQCRLDRLRWGYLISLWSNMSHCQTCLLWFSILIEVDTSEQLIACEVVWSLIESGLCREKQ